MFTQEHILNVLFQRRKDTEEIITVTKDHFEMSSSSGSQRALNRWAARGNPDTGWDRTRTCEARCRHSCSEAACLAASQASAGI